jgi:hypothetical protein
MSLLREKKTGDDVPDSIENRYFNKDLNGWDNLAVDFAQTFS